MIWSFDVAYSTHAALRVGICELDWHRVVIEAPDRDDAALLACQMVMRHHIPTAVYDRI